MSVLGVHPLQDDGAGRRSPGRRPAHPRQRRHVGRHAGLDPRGHAHPDEATDSWDDKVAVDRFVGKGGHFVRGRARVTGPHTVDVNGESITAGTALVLATGGKAWVPPMFDGVPHWTNREAIAADELPDSLLIVGGGAIGLELGQAMSRFGVAVTIVEMADRILAAEEPEVSELMAEILEREGLDIRTGVTIERAEPTGPTGCTLYFADGGSVSADRLLVATGRRSDLAALGVAALGLGLDETARALPVDARMRIGPGRVGHRRRHRPWRVHPRGHVPGSDLCGRHPGPPDRRGGLPGSAQSDLHRSRGGLGRYDRSGGPRNRAAGSA